MPKKTEVRYADLVLGDLDEYGPDDWRNPARAPSEQDFLNVRAEAVASFLHEVLGRHPLQSHPKEPDVPWPVVVVRRACLALGEGSNRKLEEESMRRYLVRHGVDRFVEIWGGSPTELARDLEARRDRDG